MRIVAVNHLHPATSHIGATRVPRLAEALAKQGHQVVLLTATIDDEPASHNQYDLARALSTHDWDRPLHVSCSPRTQAILWAARSTFLFRPLRRAVLAAHYLFHGGVFTDWRFGSKPLWPILARVFHPEVTWATFGNTDAWAIAQGIAREAGCPWVMDIKDVWNAFVPSQVSPLLIRRFSDAAACTGLSEGHIAWSGSHFNIPKTVVYSGIPAAIAAPQPPVTPFRVTLAGSTYGWLDLMVEGVTRFLKLLPITERQEIVFTYAGSEHQIATNATQRLTGLCKTDIRPYVALDELFLLHREAFANLYGRRTGHPDFFHHKIFELLCADRPIACFPGEYGETLNIAAAVRGQLNSCADPEQLATMLHQAWRQRCREGIGADRTLLAGYTWDAQARVLAAALAKVVA